MPNAVLALWQHMDEETADKLVGVERHRFIALAALDAIILEPERDAAFIDPYETSVGYGNAVGIARQIGQHGLRPSKGTLGINEPFFLTQRCQEGGKGFAVDEMFMRTVEVELTGLVRGIEFFQEQPPE